MASKKLKKLKLESDGSSSDSDRDGGRTTGGAKVKRPPPPPKTKKGKPLVVMKMTDSDEEFWANLDSDDEGNYKDDGEADDEDDDDLDATQPVTPLARPAEASIETKASSSRPAAEDKYDGDERDDEEEAKPKLEKLEPASPPGTRTRLSLLRKRKNESGSKKVKSEEEGDGIDKGKVKEEKGLEVGPLSKRMCSSGTGRETEAITKDSECRQVVPYDPAILNVFRSAKSSKAPFTATAEEPNPDDVSTDTDLDVKQEQDDDEEDDDVEPMAAVWTPPTLSQEERRNWAEESFYGNVDRTVELLSASIRNMPKPEDNVKLHLPPGLVKLYDHQHYALRWMLWREGQFPGGGILADEMGLGKTISIIALVMKSKLDAPFVKSEDLFSKGKNKRQASGATLIVCPTGCLHQWKKEILLKGRNLKVTMYHGAHRTRKASDLSRSDIVLSTFGTVATDIPDDDRMWDSPLKNVFWKRIVLDEAHNIRNPKTNAAIAICNLDARYRWAVTGTPVHNRPEDFYSLVKFLRMVPFNDSTIWRSLIGLKTVNLSDIAKQRLHIIGNALILRRTKDEVHQAGGNVRSIPPKTVEVIEIELPAAENELYQTLLTYSRELFQQFLSDKKRRDREKREMGFLFSGTSATAAGTSRSRGRRSAQAQRGGARDVGFMNILVLIIRLRQCAVHPSLIKTMLEDEEDIEEGADYDHNLLEKIISKRNPLLNEKYESAKFKKILEDLEELRQQAKMEERNMDKVVIVSSWTSLLNILNEHLRKRKFSTVFITGKQSPEARSEAQAVFNRTSQPKPQIVLLSLMAGGVGLNLVGGNHVFFVEPHWNPQMELQAQDRVHRFGQTKNVFIRRYITIGSIENRIMDLQEMKKSLADGVLNSRKSGAGSGITLKQMKHLFEMDEPVYDSDEGGWF